jgi:hypothetical protein
MLFTTPSVIFFDRKYFGSGFFSKMSDNEDSLSVLRDPEVFAVKHFPLDVIPQAIQCGEDSGESSPLVVREKPFNVLKEK